MAQKQSNPPDGNANAGAPISAPVNRKRVWILRCIAVLAAPLLALLVLEGGLRIAGYGYPTSFFLQHKGSGKRIITDNEQFGWRFFGSTLARTPRPMVFSSPKPPGTCRVFVFGESAAYGDPQPEFGLPRMLEVLLRERWPDAQFEVINVAMTAINSHVIVPIAEECARQEGDVWVIYMGNNEVVGPFGGGTIFGPQAPSRSVIQASLAVKSTRVGELITEGLSALARREPAPTEWKGLAMFLNQQIRPGDPRMGRVYSHFEQNLGEIMESGLTHGAKIVVSTVAANLKDCAPFASQHRRDLDSGNRDAWERKFAEVIKAMAEGHAAAAIDACGEAAKIDDQYAELQFRWGRACLALGRDDEAAKHLLLAREHDALRFRADSRINELIRQQAARLGNRGVALVDAEKLLAQKSPHGIIGNEYLYEHVHLKFEGNYEIARAIADQVAQALPDKVRTNPNSRPNWASSTELAAKLAWTGYQRAKALRMILLRINDPPFSNQMDYAEHYASLKGEIEQLLPATRAEGIHGATEACREALRAAPRDWVLQGMLAQLLQQTGDRAGAEAARRTVVELLPYNSTAHTDLGLLLAQENRFDDATTQFQSALRIQPDLIAATDGQALALSKQGRLDDAARLFARAARLRPQSMEAHMNLGNALAAKGDREGAREQYRLALRCDGEKPETITRLGQTAFSQGWTNDALGCFKASFHRDPTDAKTSLYLAQALGATGRHDDASAQYEETSRLSPEMAEPHLGLGMELAALGKPAQAIEQFTEAARLNPDFIQAHLNLGILFMRGNQPEAAAAHFKEVLRLDPKNSVALRFLGRN